MCALCFPPLPPAPSLMPSLRAPMTCEMCERKSTRARATRELTPVFFFTASARVRACARAHARTHAHTHTHTHAHTQTHAHLDDFVRRFDSTAPKHQPLLTSGPNRQSTCVCVCVCVPLVCVCVCVKHMCLVCVCVCVWHTKHTHTHNGACA